MKNRIGPRMQLVIDYVTANPGCNKLMVAVGTRGANEASVNSHAYGYRAVDRCIKAGLIKATQVSSWYRLEVVK